MLERTKELAETQLDVVVRLAHAAELHDDDTGEHIERMSRLCGEVALELGLTPVRADTIRHAAVLHDVGKIGVPDEILRKPGRLTSPEMATMRRHVVAGARLLKGSDSPLLQTAELIADTHHERWDGMGYPNGLAGEQIPLEGPDRRGLRRLRRPHPPAPLQAGVERRAGLRGDRRAARHALRSGRRRRAARRDRAPDATASSPSGVRRRADPARRARRTRGHTARPPRAGTPTAPARARPGG